MPDIPKYYARITPKPVGKAPIPLAAADVGAGAIGRGLQRLGRGISDIAKSIFQIEQDKQVIRDNATLASANGDYDKAVADKINEAKRTTFTSIEQFADFREQAEADLDATVQLSIGKMSLKAGQSFSNFAKSNKQNSLRQIEGIVWQKEIQFGQSDTLRQYSNKFEVLAGAGVSVEDILKDPSLEIIETGMNPYWRAGELVKARDRILIDALVNVGRYDDARTLAQTTEAFTPTEKKARLDNIDAAEKRAETARNLLQNQKDDEIGDEFLGLLINKLDPTKPQLTFDAIKSSELSFGAKESWLTKLMTFDNYSEAELKEAFTDKGEVLADIYDKIDAETLTDELDTMVGRGLSPTTAQRIKKEIREPYKKDTDQLFKRIFGWSPELGFENDLSSFLYEKTLREWDSEIKRQDATGEKIVEIGRSIARPYFIEHLKTTMAGQEADISRMVELALGEELQKTEPEVKPKEDEGPRTYQDFEDEVARLKKIDMTKARAFYDAWIEKFKGIEAEE